jgi:histidinol-phosphatase (PHP family)
MNYCFHSHSHYDDGKLAMEDFVLAAIDAGFDAFGFSGHSPLPNDNEWSIKIRELPEYVAEGKRLKEQYKHQIKLYLGLEIDYIPGMSDDFSVFVKDIPLDYCIGSVHLVRNPENDGIWFIDGPIEGFFEGLKLVFGGDVKKAVTAYFEQSILMIETQKPNIIGHLDKVKMYNKEELFKTTDAWYLELVQRLLETIKQHNTIVEVNTRGVYTGKTDEFFPSTRVLKTCYEMGIPMMINSDAHHPDQISKLVPEAIALLRGIGYKEVHTPFACYRI